MSESQRKQADEWPWDDPEYNPDADERWEHGIFHDPRTMMIMRFVVAANRKYWDSSGPDISMGGDGDPGETLAYQLDQYFFDLDLAQTENDEDQTRVVPTLETDRVETGPVKFQYADGEKDWTGVFIRGDNALHYAFHLQLLLEEDHEPDALQDVIMQGLLKLLDGNQEK